MKLENIIDSVLYPIIDQESTGYQDLIKDLRQRYKTDGIVTLPKFLLPATIHSAVKDINSKLDKVFHTDGTHNVFLDNGDSSLDQDHIRNRQLATKVGALAYDYMDPDGGIIKLYTSDLFCGFLRDVMELDELYPLADPVGACTVNVFPPDTMHAWHFDESTHSVTIMLQKPDKGGEFRHTKQIRARGQIDEKIFTDLDDILVKDEEMKDGNELVNTLEFEPGTLSLFSGSTCLHEVTQISGDKCREVAVLCYTTVQGKRNSPEVQKLFFGRIVD